MRIIREFLRDFSGFYVNERFSVISPNLIKNIGNKYVNFNFMT